MLRSAVRKRCSIGEIDFRPIDFPVLSTIVEQFQSSRQKARPLSNKFNLLYKGRDLCRTISIFSLKSAVLCPQFKGLSGFDDSGRKLFCGWRGHIAQSQATSAILPFTRCSRPSGRSILRSRPVRAQTASTAREKHPQDLLPESCYDTSSTILVSLPFNVHFSYCLCRRQAPAKAKKRTQKTRMIGA
jgi:hypothetical protein